MATGSYSDMDLEDLPPTPHELEEIRHAKVRAQNEVRERRRRASANRAQGFDQPTPGTKLHVSLDRAILRRTRAGIKFERGVRHTIEVVDASDEEVAILQRQGDRVVNVDGAERILEDAGPNGALNVHQRAMSTAEHDQLLQENAALQDQVRAQQAELAQMRKSIREARQAAPESATGAPARLNAARAAKAEQQSQASAKPDGRNLAAAATEEFGGPGKPE